MQPAFRLAYGRQKPKPDPQRIKELAAAGNTRAEIAAALNIKYKRLCDLLTHYGSMHDAYTEGVRQFKEQTHHASSKTPTQDI